MRRMLVGVVLASVFVAACGGSKEQVSVADVTEYVGTVAGMDPAVPEAGKYVLAVTIAKDGKVVAYACDGLGTSASLTGTEQGGRLDLRSNDGAGQLQAALKGSTITGTVTVAGSAQAFTATKQTGVGGLYTLQLKLSSDEHAVTITGASEPGNRLEATLRSGQAAPFALSFTLVDGSNRTVRLGAQCCRAPAACWSGEGAFIRPPSAR